MYNHPGMKYSGFRNVLTKWLLSFTDPRWAFLQAALVYFAFSLFGGSPFRTSEVNYFNYLADAFLHGQLNLRLIPQSTHDLVVYHNQLYLYWPPFPAVVLMPLVLVFGVNLSDVFFTVLVGALNVAGVSLLLRAAQKRDIIQISNSQQAWLVIFFAFGTVHMTLAPHGNVWFTAQLIGFQAILITYWAAISLEGWKAYLVSGIGMAAAIATRNNLVFLGLWPAWYLVEQTRQRIFKNLARNILIGLLPLFISLGLLLLYNQARFGNPFDVGLDLHNMAPIFRPDYEIFGAFNLHYVPLNFFYQYIFYPFPVSERTFMGGSLFLLSPVFLSGLWALWSKRNNLSTWLLLTTIILANIPILLLMGTGWVQFGPRYSLDFTIPLLLLTASGISNFTNRVIGFLTTISIIHYFFGAYLLLI